MKALTLSNLICLVGMRNKPSSVRPPSRRDMIERASGLAILRLHAFKWSTRSSPKIGLIVVSWSIPREKSKKFSRQIFIRFLPNFLACCATLLQKTSEAKTQNEKLGLVTSFLAVSLYGFLLLISFGVTKQRFENLPKYCIRVFPFWHFVIKFCPIKIDLSDNMFQVF